MKNQNPKGLTTFYRFSKESFIGIFIAIVSIFLIIPLFFGSFFAHLAMQLGFVVLIFSTLNILQAEKKSLYIGLTIGILYLLLDGLSILLNSIPLMVFAYAFSSLFLLLAIGVMSKKMFSVQVVDTNLLFGVFTIYFLAGILWAKLFFIINTQIINSFHGVSFLNPQSSSLGDGYKIQFDLLYYSFTTLATLGLGDIVPIQPFVRSLTLLEAIFGQLFVATVISKMVSIWKNPNVKES
jgi:Ion channel